MVSIVVPCYNCENTLKRCLDSITKQTQSNIEIILVDDGSTDSTYELCKDIAKRDLRVKVIHQQNKGPIAARNIGITNAQGEYVAFCDADDYIECDLIEKIEKTILKYNADIIAFGMKVAYEDGTVNMVVNKLHQGYYTRDEIRTNILPIYFSHGKMESNIILHSLWSKVIRKRLLLEVLPLLNDKITIGEDALTVFSAVLLANSIYCMGNYNPYIYMRNSESAIGRYDGEMFEKRLLLRKAFLDVAQKLDYCDTKQIEVDFFENTLMDMKKEICRNSQGYGAVKSQLVKMRENYEFCEALKVSDVKEYDAKSKLFAKLVIGRRYFLLYFITKIVSWLGVGAA